MLTPSLFVSHGSPNLPFEQHDAVPFLRQLGRDLTPPRAIAVISAHWEAHVPTVSLTSSPKTIHDFAGFPDQLYRLRYPAPGAPEVARRAFELMREQLPAVCQSQERGLDHGAWVPLWLMFPDAQIPCFQISIQTHQGPAGAYALGQALAPLREEGVLLLGSGAVVHNLRRTRGGASDVPEWAEAFDRWIEARIHEDDRPSLINYRALAPEAEQAQPSEEHLLPLMVIHGASAKASATTLYRGFSHGSLSMTSYGFGM